MLNFNSSHMTNGLILKVLKACHETFKNGAFPVGIENRKNTPIINVKRVKVYGKNRFVIIGNNGENLARLFSDALQSRAVNNNLDSVLKFVVNNLLWQHEIDEIRAVR